MLVEIGHPARWPIAASSPKVQFLPGPNWGARAAGAHWPAEGRAHGLDARIHLQLPASRGPIGLSNIGGRPRGGLVEARGRPAGRSLHKRAHCHRRLGAARQVLQQLKERESWRTSASCWPPPPPPIDRSKGQSGHVTNERPGLAKLMAAPRALPRPFSAHRSSEVNIVARQLHCDLFEGLCAPSSGQAAR